MTRLAPIAAVVLGLVAGCKETRSVGHFGDTAFHHVRDHYRIRYLPEGERLLPPPWRLANYELDASGAPAEASQDAAYWTGYAVDHPRAGVRQVRAERVDLRYEHQANGAMLWARTVPTSEGWADAPVGAILRDAVRGMASGEPRGLDLVGHPLAQGRRTEVALIGQGPAVVDGVAAHWATFDLASPNAGVIDRYTVVLVRPPNGRWRYERWSFPMLLILGYASRPSQHAALRPTFEGFVERVDFAPGG